MRVSLIFFCPPFSPRSPHGTCRTIGIGLNNNALFRYHFLSCKPQVSCEFTFSAEFCSVKEYHPDPDFSFFHYDWPRMPKYHSFLVDQGKIFDEWNVFFGKLTPTQNQPNKFLW